MLNCVSIISLDSKFANLVSLTTYMGCLLFVFHSKQVHLLVDHVFRDRTCVEAHLGG